MKLAIFGKPTQKTDIQALKKLLQFFEGLFDNR